MKAASRAIVLTILAVGCSESRPPTSLPRSDEPSLAKSTSGVKVTDVGGLGGVGSDAYGVNDAGQVVGESYDASGVRRAFLWQNGVLTPLEPVLSAAQAISNTAPAYIAGWRREPNDSVYAVRWVAGDSTRTRVLDTLRSRALGVNDAGTLVGIVCDSGCDGGSFTDHAAIWHVYPDRVERTRIYTPGHNQAQAYDINNAGDVAGLAYSRAKSPDVPPPMRGFLYTRGGKLLYLPPLAGYPESDATGLSEPKGDMVFVVGASRGGASNTGTELMRATRWTVRIAGDTGHVMAVEAIVPTGDSRARKVNNAGYASGTLINGDREDGFFWRDGTIQKLPPLKGHGETWVYGMNRGTTRAGAPFYVVGESYKSGCWPSPTCLESRAVLWAISN